MGDPDLAHVLPKHRDGGGTVGFFGAEAFGLPAASERYLARGADISDPVSGPIACDQPALVIALDDVDRSRVEPPGLAPGHREDVPIRRSQPEPGQGPEERVDHPRTEAQPVGLRHPGRVADAPQRRKLARGGVACAMAVAPLRRSPLT